MGKYGKSFTINGIFMVITILHETFSTIWENLIFFSKKIWLWEFFYHIFKKIVTNFFQIFNFIYGNIFTIFLYERKIIFIADIYGKKLTIFFKFLSTIIFMSFFSAIIFYSTLLFFIDTHMKNKLVHRIFLSLQINDHIVIKS